MEHALPHVLPASTPAWRHVALPREHGSWSLVLEPLVFGLIAVPSPAGGWLALGALAAFLARRPMRLVLKETRADEPSPARVMFSACTLVTLVSLLAADTLGPRDWLLWLLPAGAAGMVFLRFDLRNSGREGTAEVAGAAAFALIPAAIAVLGGASPAVAAALAIVMLGRAVPTVLTVRSALRTAKTGVHRPGAALLASSTALVAGVALALASLAPRAAVAALAILALRAVLLLVFPRPALRARTLGAIETVLGAAFVLSAGLAFQS